MGKQDNMIDRECNRECQNDFHSILKYLICDLELGCYGMVLNDMINCRYDTGHMELRYQEQVKN